MPFNTGLVPLTGRYSIGRTLRQSEYQKRIGDHENSIYSLKEELLQELDIQMKEHSVDKEILDSMSTFIITMQQIFINSIFRAKEGFGDIRAYSRRVECSLRS